MIKLSFDLLKGLPFMPSNASAIRKARAEKLKAELLSKKEKAKQVGGGVAAVSSNRTKHAEFVFEGDLQYGHSTDYAVHGVDIHINNDTWVFGDLRIGAQATVKGIYAKGDQAHAKKIIINAG